MVLSTFEPAGIVRRVSVDGSDDGDRTLDELQAENERLRADLETAGVAARTAEQESGQLRGTIAELQVQLIRARQDQEGFQTWSARQRVLAFKDRVGRRVESFRAR